MQVSPDDIMQLISDSAENQADFSPSMHHMRSVNFS